MLHSPSFENLPDFIKLWILLILPLALKNFQWVVLISESHYTLPSSVSEVIAILLCLACYLVCMMIFPVLLNTCALVWSAALGQHRGKDDLPGWIGMILIGVTFVVTDRVTSYYMDPAFISEFLSGSLRFLTYMMATLLSLAGYLYLPCMVALSCLVLIIADGAIQRTRSWWPELIHTSIVGLTLLLLNLMWGSPVEKPSNASDIVGLAGYLIYIVSSMALSYRFFGPLLLLKTFIISLTFVLLDMFVTATTLLALFFLVALSFALFFSFLHIWIKMLVNEMLVTERVQNIMDHVSKMINQVSQMDADGLVTVCEQIMRDQQVREMIEQIKEDLEGDRCA